MTHFTESIIEETALEWLKDMGYTIVFGGDIAPEEPERSSREDKIREELYFLKGQRIQASKVFLLS